MIIVDAKGKSEFVMLDGTGQKFAFDWPTGACPPGAWGLKVYQAFRQELRAKLARETPHLVPLVDGILLAWIYTSIEATRLREANEALEKRVRKLEHEIANVQQWIATRSPTAT